MTEYTWSDGSPYRRTDQGKHISEIIKALDVLIYDGANPNFADAISAAIDRLKYLSEHSNENSDEIYDLDKELAKKDAKINDLSRALADLYLERLQDEDIS